MALLGVPTWTTTAGNKTITATPLAGSGVLVVCGNSGRTTAQAPVITDNNGSGTYSLVASATRATSIDSMWIFVRNSATPANTSTIYTMTTASDTGGGMVLFELGGALRFGPQAVCQVGSQNNIASGTPAIVLGKTTIAANYVVCAVMTGSNVTTNSSAPTGLTERFDNGYATPATGLEACEGAGITVSTLTWNAVAPSAFCSIMVEIEAADIVQRVRPYTQILPQ